MADRPSIASLTKKFRKVPLRLLLLQRHWRTPASRVLVLDLTSHYRFGPYLMAAFADRGYSVEVVKRGAYVPDPKMMLRMGLGMVSVPRPTVGHPEKTLVHDAVERDPGSPGPWGRVVRLDYDYYRRRTPVRAASDEIFGPYFMHPNVYESGLHRSVRSLREGDRSIRVFFAGTVARDAHARTFRWRYPSRAQVIAAVMESFPSHIDPYELDADPDAFLRARHPIVLAVTPETADTLGKHLLTQAEMLRFAGASDFFVNPPGISIPHSHNVIEAMATGSIPILAYGELFEPALVHMETCIAYDGISDFVSKLRTVLAMPAHEIRRMRENVCRYYDEHLSPEALFRAWHRVEGRNVSLRIHNSNVVSRPEYLDLVASGGEGTPG